MAHRPTRMCVICRQRFLKKELTRYVRKSSTIAEWQKDTKLILHGRGLYVCEALRCKEAFTKYKKPKRVNKQ